MAVVKKKNQRDVMKNSRYIKIAETSDNHVGHPRTSTSKVLASLRRAFPNNAETAELDIIIIAGDFFDSRLDLPDDDVYDIRFFVLEFLQMCKQHDIILRVLEGTPSHDWRQSKLFTHLNELANINANVKYIDKLSIEYIEPLNINVLYIPDEWKPTCSETWQCVEDKLIEHRLEQVDFVVMHGAFPHQMPEELHKRLDLHNSDNFSKICKYFVFVGHIHLFSQYRNILSAGSIERLAHGEEGPKGHLRVTVDLVNNRHDIIFVENKGAQIYTTIDCALLSTEEASEKITAVLKRIPHDSYVRIRCNKGDSAISVIPNLAKVFADIEWSVIDNNKGSKDRVSLVNDSDKITTGIQITRDNIKPLLMQRIKERHSYLADRCNKLLDEVLDE